MSRDDFIVFLAPVFSVKGILWHVAGAHVSTRTDLDSIRLHKSENRASLLALIYTRRMDNTAKTLSER